MNYLLLICSDGVPTTDKGATMRRELPAWVQDTGERGVRVYGEQLAGPDVAKTVRVRDGETLVSDGPFLETKEFVAGFDILDCADLDEAIDIAARHPVSWFHMIEVRPFATDPTNGDTRTFMADDRGGVTSWPPGSRPRSRTARRDTCSRYAWTASPRPTRSRPRSPATPRRGSPRWEPGGSERMGTPWLTLTPRRRCACVTASEC
jgi:hypothetical protein